MLDVHPPHAPTHTWKDFFIHIATIVVGLLIAIGLEQIVESFHHRHQVHRMEDAVRSEQAENRSVVARDTSLLDRKIAEAQGNLDRLEAAPSGDAELSPLNTEVVYALLDTAWLGMRDSGLISTVPELLAANGWKIEYTLQRTNVYIQESERLRDRIGGLERLRTPAHPHTPAEVDALRMAYGDYLQQLGRLRHSLVIVDVLIEIAQQNQPLSPSTVDRSLALRENH
jgi:hypothetical protein